jgi:hypothetical protein
VLRRSRMSMPMPMPMPMLCCATAFYAVMLCCAQPWQTFATPPAYRCWWTRRMGRTSASTPTCRRYEKNAFVSTPCPLQVREKHCIVTASPKHSTSKRLLSKTLNCECQPEALSPER